ncbi:MAG: hypothetical protein HY821_14265 [Acidobacteria bacterium]|nr:hypothetical protein [Acidobacteriota bacterium]
MTRQVLHLFRSAVVLSDDAPPAALLAWLPRWDALVKQNLGILDGENLHALYGRALTLLAPALRPCAAELSALGPLARELGLSVAVNLSLAEALSPDFDTLALLARAMVGTVYLDARQAPPSTPSADVLHLVRALRSAGVNPALVGPVARWNSFGLLDEPFLNAGTVHFAPAGRAALSSLLASGPSPFEIRNSFDPCKERLAVFVAPDGGLYPCHGLVGVEPFRIGSLDGELPLHITPRQQDLLSSWSAAGPGCLGCVEPDPDSPLPLICELHKAELLASSHPTSHAGHQTLRAL